MMVAEDAVIKKTFISSWHIKGTLQDLLCVTKLFLKIWKQLNKERPTWCHLLYYFIIYCSTCFGCKYIHPQELATYFMSYFIEPERYNPWNDSSNKSQAPEDGCINIRNMLSSKQWNNKASAIDPSLQTKRYSKAN